MNNKGATFIDRIKITLLLLNFIWREDNVAMIDIMLSKENEWEHNVITSNLLTKNRNRVKEMVSSFKKVLENIFWTEVS